MTDRDKYYNRAKQEGYRARSAYKLKQIDAEVGLFDRGDTVVDLGAAPGGWLQVAAEEVTEAGTVVGVDLQAIDDLEAPHVETVRGDMTDERTRYYLRKALGVDPDPDPADDTDPERPVDVVLSDMAPNMSGEYSLDHARSIHLARQAFDTALELLEPGGDFVVKVFDGPDLSDFRDDVAERFQYVRAYTPEASRKRSSERYLIARGRTDAPVSEGERLTVEVTDTGEEGDGVARVEGYTLFVPGAETGETVEVVVDDVKPRFGFAERVD
ncbi:23S rRNA (uridine(2552)-2'-O)-methyltransferase [Halobaculum sp. CBA1158]|uniref:23S rRNA (uridine(2552)-2'-O)-methyltransferase n=1 Tax=Halobaculum sp. CBA1158 TaxID=2904243 RepID=UPI001F2D5AED|nr:23S rRNA (uridine(2552)-2'-O)-methyltransferase [Halobaculum sp. CBA1158]UIO99866.1 23S rRNA (uridine(2552)-2'-O)-methyltransferase [Halobaculum sp. CBA1158]